MLTHLEAENFQSLRKLSLRLGKFTVVTGATGSGKSAVIRAVRLLAFNARGTGYITRGQKTCKVASGDQDGMWAVGIERSVSRGKDLYRVSQLPDPCPDGSQDPPQVDTFTKLGGEVPDAVTALLQLSDLNFAGQWGMPFLLDSTGGDVARVLGRLTNVTLLFDAARECSRRRLEIMGDLKRAEASLASLTAEAQRFRGMRERQAAVSEAEAAMERVQAISARLARLRVLAARLEAAEAALEKTAPPEVPSADRLEELAARSSRLRWLSMQLEHATERAGDALAARALAVGDEQIGHQRLHDALVAAGQCPVCGQEVA